jgi:predicted acetyltransferase
MLSLEVPSAELRPAFLEMAAEFAAHGDSRYARRTATDQQERVLPPGRVPGSEFWLVSDGRLVGCSRLRHRLTPELEHEGGHIGYDIRPSDRGRGFGTELLRLTCQRAAARGLARVRVTCDRDNVASIRVIEKNGGILDAVVPSRTREKMIHQYWIATAGAAG